MKSKSEIQAFYKARHLDEIRTKDRIYAEKKRREKGQQIRLKKEKVSASNIYIKECPITGKLFIARRIDRVYSDEGGILRALELSKLRSLRVNGNKSRFRICTVCNNEYDLFNGYTHTCSDICNDIRFKKLRKIVKYKRRAIERGLYAENVDRIKVFNRDKWHCNMCKCKTPMYLMGTYEDNAPELDHIIPLAKHGTHTYNNVQLLCRKCNGIKSDKLIGQQVIQHVYTG